MHRCQCESHPKSPKVMQGLLFQINAAPQRQCRNRLNSAIADKRVQLVKWFDLSNYQITWQVAPMRMRAKPAMEPIRICGGIICSSLLCYFFFLKILTCLVPDLETYHKVFKRITIRLGDCGGQTTVPSILIYYKDLCLFMHVISTEVNLTGKNQTQSVLAKEFRQTFQYIIRCRGMRVSIYGKRLY